VRALDAKARLCAQFSYLACLRILNIVVLLRQLLLLRLPPAIFSYKRLVFYGIAGSM
jgi:hypothetical protein